MSHEIIINIISAIVWIYSIITLPIYAIIQNPWKLKQNLSRKRAHQIASSDGICFTRSMELQPVQLEMLNNKLDTMPKVFRYSCRKNGDKKALGTRQILGQSEEIKDGKVLKKLDLGEYKWVSFTEAEELAKNFGNGLRKLGFAPSTKILIFAETRQEWLLAAMGAFMQRCTICTLYTTLDEDAIIHGITETEVETIITSSDLLSKIKAILPRCPKVKSLIVFTTNSQAIELDKDTSCKTISYDEVVKIGKGNEYLGCEPRPDDIAIIMYTSGSTGTPKGVMLSHGNITTSMTQFSPSISATPDDIFAAFLPLAHVLELLGESTMFLCGVPMGYSTPLTLTDVSSKIKRGKKGDATILKPTVLAAVPLILDRIYKSASEKASSKGPFLKDIFDFFVQYRLSWVKAGWNTPLCNRIIFKKSKDLLGGNVRIMGCGGAPLAAATHDLIRAVLGINVCQGYGLTETCATASMMDDIDDFSTGRVGPPLKLCNVKLVDWAEGGYNVFDKPNPRGEIIIGGGNIAVGYFKNQTLTDEYFYEIDGQRWFRTGDIGEIFSDGTIKIIDRKKDLVKLQMGEYISLGKIEAVLKLCSFVDNICVYGQSSHMNVIAVISLNCKSLNALEDELDVEFNDEEGKVIIKTAVLKSLTEIGKRGKLSRLEIPTDCYLTKEAWTPENKLVTSTMKIKRKNVETKYKEQIEVLYQR